MERLISFNVSASRRSPSASAMRAKGTFSSWPDWALVAGVNSGASSRPGSARAGGRGVAGRLGHAVEGDVLVVAGLGLGRRREQRGVEPARLGQLGGQGRAADGPR